MPAVFFSRIVPTDTAVEELWNSVADTPQYLEHPLRHRQHHKKWAVSIFIHGDGVPCVGVGKAWSKMDIFSWGSVLVTDGDTLLSHFLICCFYNILASGMTYPEVWAVIVWSLQALYTGKWPERDHKGNMLHDKRAGQWLAHG